MKFIFSPFILIIVGVAIAISQGCHLTHSEVKSRSRVAGQGDGETMADPTSGDQKDTPNKVGTPEPEPDDEIAEQPANVLGTFLADYDNSRIRCDYKRQSKRSYLSSCVVVVHLDSDREAVATGIKDGVSLEWADPQAETGQVRFEPCRSSADGLNLLCDVTTENDDTAKVRFGLDITQAGRGKKRESADVVLPYGVGVVAGMVPSIPFNYLGQREGVGFQDEPADEQEKTSRPLGFQPYVFAANQLALGYPNSICRVGQKIYFLHDKFIYVWDEQRVRLFAGSTNSQNENNTSSRLRIHLAPTDMACTQEALYISSAYLARVVKIAFSGEVTVVAGKTNTFTSSPDGQLATEASLFLPSGVAVSPAGELHFIEYGVLKVRKVKKDGTLVTVAGNGTEAYAGDGGPALKASFISPNRLAFGADGALYVTDQRAHVVRKIDTKGVITTVAGTGSPRYEAPSDTQALSEPSSLFVNAAGVLHIGEYYRGIKVLNADGSLSSFVSAGPDLNANILDMGAKERRQRVGRRPSFIALDVAGNKALTDSFSGIVEFQKGSNDPKTIVGSDIQPACKGAKISSKARLIEASSLDYNAKGELFVADWQSLESSQIVVRHIFGRNQFFYTEAIHGCGNDPIFKSENKVLENTLAGFVTDAIGDMVVAKDGSIYLANLFQNRIFQVGSDGGTRLIAGTGRKASDGDGGAAQNASIDRPTGLAFAPDGSLFIAESSGIRVIRNNTISTLLRQMPDFGSGADSTRIPLNTKHLAVDAKGRLFFVDSRSNGRILMYENGRIASIAGGGDSSDHGDQADAGSVKISYPSDLVVTGDGVIYFIDAGSNRVKELMQKPSGEWVVSGFFGEPSTHDCGTGRIGGVLRLDEASQAIRNSLSTICVGRPRSLAVTDSCQASQGGEVRIAVSQSFDSFANIVEVLRPCR